MNPTIAVIGAGGWGTALAVTMARVHASVRLWVFEPDLARTIREQRRNPVYLDGIEVPPGIRVGTELDEILDGADIVITAVPSHVFRGVWRRMRPHVRPSMKLVTATKGIETGSLMRMSEVIADVVGDAFTPSVAAISGPTFALEVARGKPTALVVASSDPDLRRDLQRQLSTPRFRLYTNADIVGVEIGASVKNVIAIAAGVVSGLELGHNATAALITRGLVEIMRMAEACGGRRDTLAGLAGLGDLVLTCTGQLSRNRQVGFALGQGKTKAEIISSMKMVAEGIITSESTHALARRLDVEMPIAEQIYAVLHEGKDLGRAIEELMEREPREE